MAYRYSLSTNRILKLMEQRKMSSVGVSFLITGPRREYRGEGGFLDSIVLSEREKYAF
jgi:hypothetical protein